MMGVYHKNVNLPIDQANQQCFPLYSYLAALDYPTVNLLSLDIEGAEFEVFKTIPWDKVRIELIMIEVNHSNKEEIENVMANAGYEVYKQLKNQDVIYKLKS